MLGSRLAAKMSYLLIPLSSSVELSQIDFIDRIQLRMLKYRVYLKFPGHTQCDHEGPYNWDAGDQGG